MAAINHPTLGKIEGKVGDGVKQYLGIQYATLKSRFAEPVLFVPSSGKTIDATKLGPTTLAPPGIVDFEQSLIQQTLPHGDLPSSDLDGLILNITVPEQAAPSSKLPVFVFIHGGGFATGSSNFPVYDFARVVKFSADNGLPAIGIGLNYRVGAPGFLTSKELSAAGFKTNNGLRDQRAALQWIQKHISGFGGNPANVTLVGESAGGASVTYQFQSAEPLFTRAMVMSGSEMLARPSSQSKADEGYATVLKTLGLDSLLPEERVSKLSSYPGMDLLAKLGRSVSFGPVLDNDVVSINSTFSSLASGSETYPASKWCESLMIGDCAFDGSINALFTAHRKAGIASAFTSVVEKTIPTHAAKLLNIYNLKSTTPDDEAFVSFLRFANDINFYAPTLAYAEGWSNDHPVYMYRFNAKNPWEGQWKGEANHILDVAFLFQNYNDHLSAEHQKSAKEFAMAFLKFVNGQAPCDSWKKGTGVAMVIGEEGLEIKNDEPTLVERRSAFVSLGEEIGFDKLREVWGAFVAS